MQNIFQTFFKCYTQVYSSKSIINPLQKKKKKRNNMFQIFNLKFVIRKNKNNLEQINVQKTRTALLENSNLDESFIQMLHSIKIIYGKIRKNT